MTATGPVRAGGALGGLAAMALAPPAVPCDLAFTDVSAVCGLTAVHAPSIWLFVSQVNVSSMLGGGAVGDFNRDGHQDVLVLTGGAGPDRFYVSNGDGTFTEQADEWGIAYAHMGVGSAVGDYDDDGWLDVFVTSLGPATGPTQPGRHLLYHNDGDGSFTDVAVEAGVNQTSAATADGFGAAFGDYDLDGDLDLAVTGWVLNSGSNRLFRNDGDGTFSDVTAAAGLAGLLPVRGFAPRFVDMDGDRYPELLIAADFGTSRYLLNLRNGTFVDITGPSGTGLDDNGMGQAVGDVNGDGRLDWYVTSIYTPQSHLPGVPGTGNMLYLNLGNHLYVELSEAAGVNDGGWGWGTVAADLDLDGRVDLFETNGWQQPNGPAGPEWFQEPCYVFRNLGGGSFDDVAAESDVTHDGQGRGLAALDLEGDGDQDILVITYDDPVTTYANQSSTNGCHWLRVFLDTSNDPRLAPDGFGSRVLVTAGGRTQVRSIDGGSNYLIQSELSAHFGLGGQAAAEQLRVRWTSGAETVLTGVPADRTVTISSPVPGDLDADGSVGITDLLGLLASWGACPAPPATCLADLDGDGLVGITDLLLQLAGWG